MLEPDRDAQHVLPLISLARHLHVETLIPNNGFFTIVMIRTDASIMMCRPNM
jgi:hypothetical protein